MPIVTVNMEKAIMKAKKSPNDTGERQNAGSDCRLSKTCRAGSGNPRLLDNRRLIELSRMSSSMSKAVMGLARRSQVPTKASVDGDLLARRLRSGKSNPPWAGGGPKLMGTFNWSGTTASTTGRAEAGRGAAGAATVPLGAAAIGNGGGVGGRLDNGPAAGAMEATFCLVVWAAAERELSGAKNSPRPFKGAITAADGLGLEPRGA